MNIKKMFWLLALAVGPFCHQGLQADLVGPYGTSPITFDVDANGLLSATGTSGTGTLSLSGAGTRMFWYPGKAAFRAGGVNGTQWNDTNIGAASVAFGYDSLASGSYSVAMGAFTTASGQYSTATGNSSTASGDYSVAMGQSAIASGLAATALGGGHATGSSATAMGGGSYAVGSNATAMGSAYVDGNGAMGNGGGTTVTAFDAFAVGTYNVNKDGSGATPNATTWVTTDPLFEIGNGSYTGGRHDALVVYKNGNATLNGNLSVHNTLYCAAGGDLSMGSFTAGTAP